MAINKNHEFEDLDGVKCAIVERNASKERVQFLKELLEFNKYTVIVVPSPPPKVAASPPPQPQPQPESQPQPEPAPQPPPPVQAETFTIGVTDVTFNPINAVFGRILKTKDGHVVTLAYWEQEDSVSHDDIPYYEAGSPLSPGS